MTQRSTGAVAQGLTRITCTGDIQQWEIHASKRGKEIFEEGPATAVALARTTFRRNITDAHQWLVNITLIGSRRIRSSSLVRENRPPSAQALLRLAATRFAHSAQCLSPDLKMWRLGSRNRPNIPSFFTTDSRD